MPFCSSCGTSVTGSFCSRCGAAATTPAPAAIAPAALPVRRKTNPVVWILAAIGGVILLVIAGLFVAGFYIARNPNAAFAKLVTMANPNAEVVNVDNVSKRMTIRDKRNGSEVTVSFNDLKNGRFRLSAKDDNGNVGRIEVGAGPGNLPAWLPIYPGSNVQSQLTGTGDGGKESVEGGMYTFATPNEPARVARFYQEKCRELGMTADLTMATTDGGKIAAQDEDGSRTLFVVFTGDAGRTTGSVTFKRRR